MICRSTGPDVEARADMNVTDKRGQTPLCLGDSKKSEWQQKGVGTGLGFLLCRLRSATERFVYTTSQRIGYSQHDLLPHDFVLKVETVPC